MSEIEKLLVEALDVTWQGQPYSNEQRGYYYILTADYKDKIVGCVNQALALLRAKPSAGELTKEIRRSIALFKKRFEERRIQEPEMQQWPLDSFVHEDQVLELCDLLDASREELKAKDKEIEKWKMAFRKYGCHELWCEESGESACTCGFEQALGDKP